ncbi:MAG: YggT family protein [Clostridia bacterium]|nr:YggT family protein [Clostridia bacterium]
MAFPILASALKGIVLFLHLYSWLIVISAALTLFTRQKDKPGKVKITLKKLTDPINNIFREMMSKPGGKRIPIDISPILSLILIWVISGLLIHLAEYFYHLTY